MLRRSLPIATNFAPRQISRASPLLQRSATKMLNNTTNVSSNTTTTTSSSSSILFSSFRSCASSSSPSTSNSNNNNNNNNNIKTQKIALEDGRTFEGPFFIDSESPAPGCKLTDGNDYYIGEYNDVWQRHGKGKAVLDGGSTVEEGIFVEDEFMEGTVKTQDENGDLVMFTGKLRDNQFLKGTLKHKEYSYTGGFENNVPHGKDGVLKFATGALQEGTFFRGKLHGDKCKWRLESGQIYLGTFNNGVITSGELRTPEFTYEGEFNERGQAHGVGRQEHHATTPRLIFRGHWASGTLVTGQCHTETGEPIDWQNNTDAQDQLNSKPQQVMQSYMNTKLQEARADHGEATKRFAEDADAAFSNTGKRPDTIDLGYDAGPIREAKMAEKQSRKMVGQTAQNKSRAENAADDLAQQEMLLKKAFDEKQRRQFAAENSAAHNKSLNMETEKFDNVTGGSLKVFSSSSAESGDASSSSSSLGEDISNWDLARSSLIRQRGKQMTTADTIGDQFERFKLSSSKKKKKDALSEIEDDDEISAVDDLLTEDAIKKTKNVGKSRFQGLDEADEDVVVEPLAKEDVLSTAQTKLRVDGNEPFVATAAKTHLRDE